MTKLNKKGALTLGDVPNVFLALVFIVTIGVAGYLVLAGLTASTSDTSALAAINNFTLSMDNVVGFAPVWGTIIGVAVLIGIVLVSFRFGRGSGGL